jgi:hypothetical protein
VTIEGEGAGETAILGSIVGLRTGDDLARLAVREGMIGGVLVSRREAPILEDCDLAGNEGPGLDAGPGSAPGLSRCAIVGNRAPAGGVICREGSRPAFSDCAFRDNVGTWAGAAFCADGSAPSFRRCVFQGNSAPDGGAAVGFHAAAPVLERCTLVHNIGQPIRCYSLTGTGTGNCPLELESCIVWHNEGPSIEPDDLPGGKVSYSTIEGAGAWPGPDNIDLDPRLCGCDVGSEVFVAAGAVGPGTGTAGDPYPDFSWASSYSLALAAGSPCAGTGAGGADMGASAGSCPGRGGPLQTIHLAPGEYPRLARSLLLEGTSVEGAGAGSTLVRGPVEGLRPGARLAGVTIAGSAGAGVVIAKGQSPEIVDCAISGNAGDGVDARHGDPHVLRCAIRENAGRGVVALGGRFEGSTIASNVQGGVRVEYGPVSFTDCAVLANGGSGVEAGEGTCLLDRCRLAGNALDGCAAEPYAYLGLTNCLVYANAGAGVRDVLRATVEVLTSTVAANAGEGLGCAGGTGSSLSWGNGDEPPCPPATDGLGGRDPLFLDAGAFDFGRFRTVTIAGEQHTLPDFIVAEPDYRLQPGSPAIDAVSPEGLPAEDFAGHARPCGLATDIGAFEMGDCASRGEPFARGDVDADGDLSLADAVFTLQHLFLGGPVPGCLESADLNDSGIIDIADPVHELMYLFVGGAPPLPPYPDCGVDPTPDQVLCVRSTPCSF